MIEGEKVVIRQLESGDEELLHKWRNSNQGNLYCGFKYGFLMSQESFRLQVEAEIKNDKVFSAKKMFIICKKEDLTPIGEMTYRNWDKRNRSAELGIEIGEIEERGRGYGSDAVNNFIEFMFNFLNLNRIELTTLPDNKRSISLYNKIGFKEIGIMREASFDSRKGSYSDVLYMDLLRKDWKSEEKGSVV